MDKSKIKKLLWKKRHARVRKKIIGTQGRPRVSVYRSVKHIYVQLIDDIEQRTLLSVSTLSSKFDKEGKKNFCNIESAKKLGQWLGEAAKEKNISKVVFDKSGYRYHGRIKALADAAREAGLVF